MNSLCVDCGWRGPGEELDSVEVNGTEISVCPECGSHAVEEDAIESTDMEDTY